MSFLTARTPALSTVVLLAYALRLHEYMVDSSSFSDTVRRKASQPEAQAHAVVRFNEICFPYSIKNQYSNIFAAVVGAGIYSTIAC